MASVMGRLLDAGTSRAQGHPTSLSSVGKRPLYQQYFMHWRAPEPMKRGRVYLSQGRPSAEGRFDTSAASLTNSMSLYTCKHQRLWLALMGAKHVWENFLWLGIPWPASFHPGMKG